MSRLFPSLRDRLDGNARRAVEVYTRELPEYREVTREAGARAAMLDFAVLLRRREIELGADDAPFTEADLATLRAFGAERGARGVSLASQRRVLGLHSVLTLREVQEAAGPNDVDHVMHMLGWLSVQGAVAQNAYTEGYVAGQRRFLPVAARVRRLAGELLSDGPTAAALAEGLGMPLPAAFLVTALRVTGPPLPATPGRADAIVDALLKHHRTPMTWHEPDLFVALLPVRAGAPAVDDVGPVEWPELAAAERHAVRLADDFARLTGRPCSAGGVQGRPGRLAQAVLLAARISRVAPVEAVPHRLYAVRDVFVELGTTQVPQVEQWLRDLGHRLSTGPDLVATLDAFYRHDMNRLKTAFALHIHPRTLDYRLRRVRELVGMEAASTQGVRTLSAVVAAVSAGRWSQDPSAGGVPRGAV
ncbi:PucR family transcriptional regulator [Streptomyces sp. 8K308]|uniref:PucR family transcriptional regulator n=1 Tax=Streptomyces sp. 8K308 TaxID=2530388 RepID=UPI0010537FEC|nr:helix-turn-helix domain-containing protein [Streptomyces sp. 8K308]TDC22765.1 PucR family transcriptional regulator [Streptomyces sp. 8K308]